MYLHDFHFTTELTGALGSVSNERIYAGISFYFLVDTSEIRHTVFPIKKLSLDELH